MSDQNIDGRIGRLEASMEALTSDVNRIAAAVGELTRTLSSSNRTNWGYLFAGCSFISAVIGAIVFFGVIEPLNEVKEKVADQQQKFVEHIRDGHPRRVEDKAIRNAESIQKLEADVRHDLERQEAILRREMDLMLAVAMDRIASLDRWRDAEEKDDRLRPRFSSISADKMNGELNDKIDDQIDDVSRRIDRMEDRLTGPEYRDK